MLVRGVVQHHFDDDADSALVRGVQETLEIVQGAVAGMDRGVVGDVVAVVAQRRREKGHQPDGVDAQILQIIQLLREAAEVADAVAVAVVKRADVDLIDDRVLVPKRLVDRRQKLLRSASSC